jgi:hypothetical protein
VVISSSTDASVLGLVIAARLLLPLVIPWYPLPGVIAALVLDAIDQTLFQSFTRLELSGYQGYDKALDVYYLSITYISTLRNWTNHFAFAVSRFLFYFRLVGVALFELSQWRILLFIFPNTFEYFFIWYEVISLWRDPRRLPRATVIGAAAAIWIVIKLPQEFWIHIARLDLTDVLKTALFGASPETTWGHLFAAVPGVFIGAIVAAVALIVALAWLAARRLTHPGPLAGTSADEQVSRDQLRAARAYWSRVVIDRDLLEKLALVTLIVVIFAQVLPGTRASTAQLAVGSAVVIALNTGLSHWLARRGVSWKNVIGQFVVMAAANVTILAAFQLFPGAQDLDDYAAAFFILLLSVIVTLFDRFTEVHLARFPRFD